MAELLYGLANPVRPSSPMNYPTRWPGMVWPPRRAIAIPSSPHRRSGWARAWVSLLSLGWLSLLSRPGIGAERLYLTYGIFQRSIAIEDLATYAHTGDVPLSLRFYTRQVTPEQLAEARSVLLTPIPINAVQVSQFLYTPIGEELLTRLGDVIQTPSGLSGFHALRASLILAASEPEGLTLLNVLQEFPLEGIEIDLERTFELAGQLETLISDTNRAIAQINQIAQVDAVQAPLSALALRNNPETPGSYRFQVYPLNLEDETRDRQLPVDLYLPDGVDQAPVIVISHGLGSDRYSFAYLAEHLASYGFAVAVPEHPGSNAAQLQALLAGRAADVTQPEEFLNRPRDVSFVLDALTLASQPGSRFAGRLDPARAAVIGQSFGGYTALALAGGQLDEVQLDQGCRNSSESLNASLLLQCLAVQLPAPRYDLTDPRIQAAIAINPIASGVLGESSISQIEIPVMIMSGSNDVVAPALPEQILPFSWLNTPDKYLVVIQGGTHFSTISSSPNAVLELPSEISGENTRLAQQYARAMSLAFMQTHLADNGDVYGVFLTAAYANRLTRLPLELNLVRSLPDTLAYEFPQ